eukprot:1136394-Pelagomonas_calceolata.AAC.5
MIGTEKEAGEEEASRAKSALESCHRLKQEEGVDIGSAFRCLCSPICIAVGHSFNYWSPHHFVPSYCLYLPPHCRASMCPASPVNRYNSCCVIHLNGNMDILLPQTCSLSSSVLGVSTQQGASQMNPLLSTEQ